MLTTIKFFSLLFFCITFFIPRAFSAQYIPPGYYTVLFKLTVHGPLKALVVYNKDTISGRLHFTYETDSTIPPSPIFTGERRRTFAVVESETGSYKFRVADTNLTYMLLTNSKGANLPLMRLPGHEDFELNFWRVLHSGKLSVFDHKYSFNYKHALFFFWESNRVVLSNTENPFDFMRWASDKSIKTHFLFNGKDYFINAVNSTYNLQLKSKDYRGKDLYKLISSLD